MSESDKATKRGWCIDYALRLHPKEATVTAESIIEEAKKFERYIFDTQPANVLTLAKDDRK